MRILGHGIDIVDIPRLAALVSRDVQALDGWFTKRELLLVPGGHRRVEFIAGRIAAKEAVAKALGLGFAGEFGWQDIEVLASPEGVPVAGLSRIGRRIAGMATRPSIVVSISHARTFAIASAIVMRPTGPTNGNCKNSRPRATTRGLAKTRGRHSRPR